MSRHVELWDNKIMAVKKKVPHCIGRDRRGECVRKASSVTGLCKRCAARVRSGGDARKVSFPWGIQKKKAMTLLEGIALLENIPDEESE